MPTINNLAHETKEFFKRYWNSVNGQPPDWSEGWDFDSTIPNNEKRGCYALIKGKEVIYIGVGIGSGDGLGHRLNRCWKVNKNGKKDKKYMPSKDWMELTTLMTIGFSEEHYSLAAALEIFLINKLNPKINSLHK